MSKDSESTKAHPANATSAIEPTESIFPSCNGGQYNKRLEEVTNKAEICIQEAKFDEAKPLVKEQFVILKILQRNKGENQDSKLEEKFFKCAGAFLACDLHIEAFGCFYRGLLEVKDNQVPHQIPYLILHIVVGMMSSGASIQGLTSTQQLRSYADEKMLRKNHVRKKEKLTIVGEVREMTDDRLRTSGREYHSMPMAIYKDLDNIYLQLLLVYPKEMTNIIEERLMAIIGLTKCLMHAGNFDVVAENICTPLTRSEYSESAELHFIWAQSLKGDGKLDVALRKAEKALELAKTEVCKSSMIEFIKELQNDIKTKDIDRKPVYSDEWLEDTNINEPLKNRNIAEAIKEKHVPKPKHKRPKAKVHIETTISSTESITNKPIGSSKQHGGGDNNSERRSHEKDLAYTSTISVTEDIERLSKSDEQNMQCIDLENSTIDECNFDEEGGEESDCYDSEDDETYYEKSLKESATEEDILSKGLALSQKYIRKIKEKDKKEFYSKCLYSREELEELLVTEPDKYKKCILQIENAHKAFCTPVIPESNLKQIEICGRSKAGKHFSNDIVVVQLLEKPENKKRLAKQIQKSSTSEERKTYGQVVGMLSRKKGRDVDNAIFICELDEYEFHLMRPFCKTIPKINILHDEKNKYQIVRYCYNSVKRSLDQAESIDIDPSQKRSYIFIVAFLFWKRMYPKGAVIRIIKSEGIVKKQMEISRLQYQISCIYRPETLKDVQRIIKDTSDEQLQFDDVVGREDLTESLSVFTIDPQHSKDLDDALSIQTMEDGCFCVGVHISDVTAFIKKGVAIDLEARDRATTFYPGQKCKPFHMFPEPISENLCSLLPNKKRFALSFYIFMDEEGKQVKKSELKATLIRSRCRFTYTEVQEIIMSSADVHLFSKDLKNLFRLAKQIRFRRLGHGVHALPAQGPSCFSVDNNSVVSTIESQYLVEEFMILANFYAADFVLEKFPDCAILRCQNEPSLQQIQESLHAYPLIANFLKGKHLSEEVLEKKKIPCRELAIVNKAAWDTLQEAVKNNRFVMAFDVIANHLHPEQCLAFAEWMKIQERAKYQCNGGESHEMNMKHFSLNREVYTHFTSPIRRYSDIVIHRLIHAAMDGTLPTYTVEELDNLCQHLNETSKRANEYHKQCQLLQFGNKLHKTPLMLTGVIQDVIDTKIVFIIPGLTNLPQSCRELPLKFLKVSQKPITEGNDGSLLQLHWQQRLYSHTGFALQNERKCNELDPHTRAAFLTESKVNEIKTAMLSENRRLLKDIVEGKGKFNAQPYIRPEAIGKFKGTVMDVSSESHQGIVSKHLVDFSMRFSRGQIIGVQLCAELQRGILVPSPQVLDLTNNFKVCLQHTKDPIKHLAYFSTTRTKRKNEKYSSSKEYLKIWLPIMEMESATTAVREDSVVINDLPVKLDIKEGKFKLTQEFCKERNIGFSSMSSSLILTGDDDDDDEDESLCKLNDFICVRYEPETRDKKHRYSLYGKSIWIEHGKINEVKKRKGTLDFHFDVNSHGHNIPAEATKGKAVEMTVEIMKKSKSDSRTEVIIGYLEKSSDIAKSVALGSSIPKLGIPQKNLAYRIGFDVENSLLAKGKEQGLAKNNGQQDIAIKTALTSSFSLIQGPPGTGKTYTGIKLVYLFTKINKATKEQGTKHVLFCGPSNKSVDLVANWMIRKLGDKKPSLVRMYGSTLENVDFPKREWSLSKRSTRINSRPDKNLKEYSLHHSIRKPGKPYAEDIIKFDKKFCSLPAFLDMEQMNQYQKDLQSYEKLVYRATEKELINYEVIFCTTAMATNPRFIRSIKGRISQCIIDECGMCTEPECIATLIATKAKQVVLIGDHKQLRPVVMCKAAADLGLNISLFERYAEHATFLDIQYRMNPEICGFVSQQFYDGMLKTGLQSTAWFESTPLSIWPRPDTRLVFCHIEGTEDSLAVATEEGNEKSCKNMDEVEKVFKIVTRMIYNERVKPKFVNVMSQYNAQCYAIKQHFRSNGFTQEIMDVSINTVVASQGGEWDYVVFSTVRSLPHYKIEPNPTLGWCKQNLGFITDHHQINVALSRAKKGIIIVGNKHLLKCDKVWNNLLQYYRERGCLVEGSEFPPSLPTKHLRRAVSHFPPTTRARSLKTSRQISTDK